MASNSNYGSLFSTRRTPQSDPIPGKSMSRNNAGGYAFTISPWERLTRFLIIGSLGGTYYVNERELTVRNASVILDLIKEDGRRVVDEVISISDSGRAPSNDPALFVLALVSAEGNKETRKYALHNLSKVARTGTHLLHFISFANEFRGLGGRAMSTAISHWYNDMDEGRLAYQLLKYQSRDGWSQADVIRLTHPKPKSEAASTMFDWAINGWHWPTPPPYPHPESPHPMTQIVAFEYLKRNPTEENAVRAIVDHNLTREMIPTELLKSRTVWEALLSRMPLWAMVRNLGNMSKVDLLKPMSDAERTICSRLRDQSYIYKSRMHPLALLVALKTYAQGHGYRSSSSWDICPKVVDALDDAFYLAFDNVEPTHKRIMISLDVSGSMAAPFGNSPLSCCEAGTALSLVTASTEEEYLITRFNTGIQTIPITPRSRLDDALRYTRGVNWGGTDCSLPMVWARRKDLLFDAFIVITDSETWAGDIHPVQALDEYRRWSNNDATKLIVVGMTSSGFSIADPDDSHMLDVVGFDTSTPSLISEFLTLG